MDNLDRALKHLDKFLAEEQSTHAVLHIMKGAFRAYHDAPEKSKCEHLDCELDATWHPPRRHLCHEHYMESRRVTPAPAPKLEAGCVVVPIGYEGMGPRWTTTVVYVLDNPRNPKASNDGPDNRIVFCGDGEKRAAHNLTVTKAAVPEVEDYVLVCGQNMAVIRAKSNDPSRGEWVVRHSFASPSYVNREDFTIIAKAKGA